MAYCNLHLDFDSRFGACAWCEVAALRKRVEELGISAGSAAMTIRLAQARAEKAEQENKETLNLVWRYRTALESVTDSRQTWAERAGVERERAEKAERERDAALESLASYQAASHNYVRCYELNRQLQADLDTTKNELSEAQAALWRVIPNTITVEGGGVDKGWPGADPFEGPGETYQAAYERVKADLDAALDALDYYVGNRFHGAGSVSKAKAVLEKRRRRG